MLWFGTHVMSGHYGKLVCILIVTKGVGLFLGVCLFYGMVYGVGEISLLLIALKLINLVFSVAVQLLSTRAKPF